jgi:DNA-binding MarR family transcriptional regulator
MAASEDPGIAPELADAWPALVGLIMQQRWRWAEVAEQLGISQAGVRGLLAIDPDQPRSMGELARELNCDRSYVTAIVDDLERAGLAERRVAAEDRRVKTIALTPDGSRALRTVQDSLMRPPSELSTLTAAQQRTLATLVRKAAGGGGR